MQRLGIDFVVLDANEHPGGAWQHRWDSLTMRDVHGVADLPGMPVPDLDPTARANETVPAYFASYEAHFHLPVERPVTVTSVTPEGPSPDALLTVDTSDGRWSTRAIVNATGTWDTPFLPYYPGARDFTDPQFHTASYPGPEFFRGKRLVVVGGGASAVQFIGELAGIASGIVWVTRREPVWRTGDFDPEAGREAVAMVEDRVRRGLPPRSVVSVTGLALRPQERRAAEMGIYEARRPMFDHVEADGVRWADDSFERADAIVWATGFRASIGHLTPLRLRGVSGGIQLEAPRDPHTYTTAARDGRIHFVGYGPSASTIGATRAGGWPRSPSATSWPADPRCALWSPRPGFSCPQVRARSRSRGRR
nr:NAD(P)-binding domain-containing protein [Tessaracoccus coleopterorum]